jgi:serine/threonine-protein kinase
MGEVFRARDAVLEREVAIKVLHRQLAGDHGFVERFRREARAAANLSHQNIVAVHDWGAVDGIYYMVMEFVRGPSAREILNAEGVLAPAQAADVLAQTLAALDHAHRQGIVHRDVKPENVMIRGDGVVKVLDFGIARRARGNIDPTASTQTPANETPALPTLTVEGIKLGTPVYMAPEQIRGQALDGRVDQFAWGVLAFELLTGKLPWRGASDVFAVVASILTDQVDGAVLDAASLRPEVRDVVLRVLSKRPEDRFISMDDVVRALEAAARGEAAPSPRFSPPARAPEPHGPAASAQSPAVSAQSATMAQRYSTQEVRDVLARAIEQQAAKNSDSRLGFDDLLAAAREVGVDTETLREASRGLRGHEEQATAGAGIVGDRNAWIRRQRRQFYRHAGVYVIVHAALLMGLLLLFPAYLPYLGIHALLWGMGLAIHGMIALTANEDDWTQEKEGMRWWIEQRRRRHEVALARAAEKRSAPRLERGRAARQRVEARPEPAQARVRVAADTDSGRIAEEEAALVESSEAKRRLR